MVSLSVLATGRGCTSYLPLRAAEIVLTWPSIELELVPRPVPTSCVEEPVISLDSMPAVAGCVGSWVAVGRGLEKPGLPGRDVDIDATDSDAAAVVIVLPEVGC